MTRTPFLRCRTDSRRAIAILLVAILIPIFAMSPALAQTLTITHDGVDIGVIGATNLPSNETEAGSSGGTANPIIPNFGADWIDGGPPPNAATGLKNMLGPYLGAAYDVGAHERSLGVAWTGPRQFTDFLAYGLPQGWIVASEATLAQAKYTKLNAPALRDGRVVIVKQDDNVPAFIAVDFESQENESGFE
ncbi:MAG: hypothetical protein IH991_08310, partial [Planctomycetes bacterium]|nr:hypothetical protein [Planctomycetota bacterium]